MEKVRIGNDMRVNFSVYRNGQPESLDGASNISTKLVNEAYNKEITHTYTISGNVVQFDIDALQLTQCGKCRLFISYTKGGDYTVDSPAFELVNYTDQTGGTAIIGVEIVSINISGDIGINRDGLSAYEVWEAYPGNEGKTIEEYFLWLRENPTKIDLDGLNSNLDKLHFKADTLVQLTNIGDVRYSQESRTLEVKVSDTVSIQLGQEMQTRVKNDEAIQINNGQMVYINSAVGANPLAKIASTSNADVAQKTFGMATENIPANGFGAITTEGLVRDINTSAFPEGSMLWLGTNGNVTNVEPIAPVSKISVGMVLRSNSNNGVVYVKIRAIARNQKLSDVYAPTLTGGDVLRWNSTTLRFEVYNINTALSLKTDTSRKIIAGLGLTGGGDFTTDKTIDIGATDDSIAVAADGIKANTVDNLTTASITKPLSANQGKVLNEKAVQLETDLNKKVDEVTGKGLSTNDYTTVEKNKVANLPSDTNAQLAEIDSTLFTNFVRVIETIQGAINGTTGNYASNASAVCTDFIQKSELSDFNITSGLRLRCYQYKADNTFIGSTVYEGLSYKDTNGSKIEISKYTFDPLTTKVRFSMGYNSASAITPSNVVITKVVKVLIPLKNSEDILNNTNLINQNIADIEEINRTKVNGLEYLKYYINNILCIGDSLTQGVYANGGLDGHSSGTSIAENYPYFLKKMGKWEVTNAGVSGYSPVNWWNDTDHGFSTTNFALYDAVIIWLGTNGAVIEGVSNGLTDTLDIDVNPYTDYNDFTVNGTGCYCKIISKAIAQNPKIRIFLAETVKEPIIGTNVVISKIAAKYPGNVVGVIRNFNQGLDSTNILLHPFYYDSEGNVVVGDASTGNSVSGNLTHFGKVGYLHIAKHFLDEISRLIDENELKYYEYILVD